MGRFSRLFKGSEANGPQDVGSLLTTLRDEIVANERDGRGLVNRPRYQRALTALKAAASAGSPELLAALDRPTGEIGSVDHALLETVVEALGASREPAVISALSALLSEHVGAEFALAGTDEGTAVLLATTAGEEEGFRRQVAVGGLAASRFRSEEVSSALESALADSSPHVRHAACLAFIRRPGKRPSTVDKLRELAADEPEEWVRKVAGRALTE